MQPAVVDARFRQRRVQNWVFLGLMYAMFYMARYNLSVADPYLLKAFGWNLQDFGILKSAGLITYGIAVFLNGPIADRIGGEGGPPFRAACPPPFHNPLPQFGREKGPPGRGRPPPAPPGRAAG